MHFPKLLLPLLFICCLASAQRPEIVVDVKDEIGPMQPVWAWFGYDEPNYIYMKDGKKLLTELSELMLIKPANLKR